MSLSSDILLDRVLPAMAAAPSSHNTQPWRFHVREGAVDVLPDFSRRLVRSDPTDRQLYVSVGCAVENGVAAASALRHEARVEYVASEEERGGMTARIVLEDGTPDIHRASLSSAVRHRLTNRVPFGAAPLSSSERVLLPALEEAGVIVVEGRATLDEVASLAARGARHQLARRDFRRELGLWMRGNRTLALDGMPGYGFGIPAPFATLLPRVIHLLPLHLAEGPNTRRQAASASVVAVITTPGDTPRDFLAAGRTMERLWLEVTAAGLWAAPLTTLVEATNGVRENLRQFLRTERFPQAVLRIGRASHRPRPSPRRPVRECTKVM